MARQIISTGTAANDGTGDTLRSAANKINANFAELYEISTGDSGSSAVLTQFSGASVQFEGTNIDAHQTLLSVTNPTADRTVLIPDYGGNIVVDSATQTLKNKTILAPEVTVPTIKDASSSYTYNVVVSTLAASRNVTLPALQTADNFVFADHAETLTNKTLTGPTISSPKISTEILDAAGARLLELTPTAGAVYNIDVSNADSSTIPSLTAAGAGTDINLDIQAKGNASVRINKVRYNTATVTGAGAIPAASGHIILNSNSGISTTLADGTNVGEQKIFTNKGNGTVRVTPNNIADPAGNGYVDITTLKMCIMIWDGSNWFYNLS